MDTTFEQWFTGFVEGDGHIARRRSDGYLVFALGQSVREPLDFIASQLSSSPRVYTYSTQYQLKVSGSKCLSILDILSTHVVNPLFVERLNGLLLSCGKKCVLRHVPTLDWLSGFWDAEGTSDRTPSIGLSQASPEVLYCVRETFGGSVHEIRGYFRWILRGNAARPLVEKIALRSHIPSKRIALLHNFGAQTYSEQNRASKKLYDAERDAHRKLVREYIHSHPEVVNEIMQKQEDLL